MKIHSQAYTSGTCARRARLVAHVAWRFAFAADDTIKIGLLATFEGPFTVLGRGWRARRHDGGRRGTGRQGRAARRSRSSRARPTPRRTAPSAQRASSSSRTASRSSIGPLSGDEGIAVKEYAKTQPDVTFINGTSAAQDTTLPQSGAELLPLLDRWRAVDGGSRHLCLHDVKGYKKVATVAEDYSFPYTQVFGFMAEFCKAGGTVPSKSWVPIGNKDYSSVIAAIPDDVDAIYVALGGADARQLPDAVPAGRRHRAADRRLDHRRPDRA